MAWIKRNLFFVVGGIITVLLLGGAGYYIYNGWSHNSTAYDKLNEVVGQLKSLKVPSNDKIDNTQIAKDQNRDLTAWNNSSVGYFRPVPAIPARNVTSATYATALSSTIGRLQEEAKSDGVILPPQCTFSFSKQMVAMTFDPSSLAPLAEQLGEVKAIVELLFAARINALDGVQRVRLPDDMNGTAQSDYINDLPVTNNLAVVTPYVVTFRCFTPELARVISEFATASNTFIVESVDVQPADTTAAAAGEMQPGMQPGFQGDGGTVPGRNTYRGFGVQPPPPVVQPVTGKGGLPTVLKEQLLLVRLEVALVKLSPKH
jgi:hypothetical protein